MILSTILNGIYFAWISLHGNFAEIELYRILAFYDSGVSCWNWIDFMGVCKRRRDKRCEALVSVRTDFLSGG